MSRLREHLQAAMDELERRYNQVETNDPSWPASSSGDLRGVLGSLPVPGLSVVVGRPGSGVSSLIYSLSAAALRLGQHVALLSTESTGPAVARRLLVMTSGVPTWCLDTCALEAEDWPRIHAALRALADAKLEFGELPPTPKKAELCGLLQDLRGLASIQLVLIDSLAPGSAGVAGDLRTLARDHACRVVVALRDPRLMRAPRAMAGPQLPDNWDRTADLVAVLERSPTEHNHAALVITRSRLSHCQSMQLRFDEYLLAWVDDSPHANTTGSSPVVVTDGDRSPQIADSKTAPGNTETGHAEVTPTADGQTGVVDHHGGDVRSQRLLGHTDTPAVSITDLSTRRKRS